MAPPFETGVVATAILVGLVVLAAGPFPCGRGRVPRPAQVRLAMEAEGGAGLVPLATARPVTLAAPAEGTTLLLRLPRAGTARRLLLVEADLAPGQAAGLATRVTEMADTLGLAVAATPTGLAAPLGLATVTVATPPFPAARPPRPVLGQDATLPASPPPVAGRLAGAHVGRTRPALFLRVPDDAGVDARPLAVAVPPAGGLASPPVPYGLQADGVGVALGRRRPTGRTPRPAGTGSPSEDSPTPLVGEAEVGEVAAVRTPRPGPRLLAVAILDAQLLAVAVPLRVAPPVLRPALPGQAALHAVPAGATLVAPDQVAQDAAVGAVLVAGLTAEVLAVA